KSTGEETGYGGESSRPSRHDHVGKTESDSLGGVGDGAVGRSAGHDDGRSGNALGQRGLEDDLARDVRARNGRNDGSVDQLIDFGSGEIRARDELLDRDASELDRGQVLKKRPGT